MKVVHVAFTLFQRDENSFYPMALAAAYVSIRQRTQSILNIHIIVDKSVSIVNKQKIKDSISSCDVLHFYNAEDLGDVHELSLLLDTRFSPAIVWRVWLDVYLKHLGRCILMDCDFICAADIDELWDLDLGPCLISAPLRTVPHSKVLHQWLDVPPGKYFRMCCSVLNLDKMRQHQDFVFKRRDFLLEAASVASTASGGLKQAGLLEQSVFNKFFSNLCFPLPIPVIPISRISGHPRETAWKEQLVRNKSLLFDIKGWTSPSPYAALFWSALFNTAWRGEAIAKFEI